MGKEVAAGFLLFRRLSDQIQYLLLQASYGTGHWTPPKGHLEAGETEFEAALRETKEEAGYSEADLKVYKDHFHEMHYQVKGNDKRVIYWLAELENPQKEPELSDEHVARKWLPKDEAIALSGFSNFEEMVRKFHDVIVSKLS
ncbi:bis(5'-nucleosyl)-tetraphosphatase [asymmetrical] [Phlebotomus argentipes]|uniref:bis(5'-nucleosyl)-tetraphosphatase [asymmetrical] n=1 Tax=Phlebotomus argentipes TaxID=94469 RepID=UPI002892D95A|nr:bis(5'-nucleosyl)-tetraphosphatase [asymmetrical] [Phlebotomus argentipes]